ncbi:MAG: type II secretion system protein [Candidatus Omnitrophica bacterium]|nr:type II secretion system protein [Candidatus Omnitrophota bacterium]MBL7210446.1 type II secretion system protein [Candidatus Omnitrophota bacterium]
MQRGKGFTLIELVMIIVILGILSAVALPKYFDIQTSAKISAEKGVVGGVRAGLSTYYANQCVTTTCVYPSTLDSASTGDCSTSNPCFDTVLAQGGITSDEWEKASATTYTGPAGNTYTYNSSTGEFLE